MSNNERTFIIDIQGFTDDFGSLIPKEVAWTSLSGAVEMHAIISPPCSWDLLLPKSQIVNDYLIKGQLGIPWTQTGISHDHMATFCTHIPPDVSTIYTYHHKARNLLHLFEHQKLICLCDKIPRLDYLNANYDYCHFHQPLDKKFVCARKNVNRIREYLLTVLCPSPDDIPPAVYSPKSINYSISPNYIKSPGFLAIEPRLLSYFLWHNKIIEPTQLSEAGLFYTGHNDETECFACGIKIALWLPGDDPYQRHRKASPQCILSGSETSQNDTAINKTIKGKTVI